MFSSDLRPASDLAFLLADKDKLQKRNFLSWKPKILDYAGSKGLHQFLERRPAITTFVSPIGLVVRAPLAFADSAAAAENGATSVGAAAGSVESNGDASDGAANASGGAASSSGSAAFGGGALSSVGGGAAAGGAGVTATAAAPATGFTGTAMFGGGNDAVHPCMQDQIFNQILALRMSFSLADSERVNNYDKLYFGAKTLLRATVSEPIYDLVKGISHPWDQLTRLEQECKPAPTAAWQEYAILTLQQVRMTAQEPVAMYTSRLNDAFQLYEAAFGMPLADTHKRLRFIEGLIKTGAWNGWTLFNQHNLQLDYGSLASEARSFEFTSEATRAGKILTTERALSANEPAEIRGGNSGRSGGSGGGEHGGPQRKLACWNCGKEGHKNTECREKSIKCTFCYRLGHKQTECRLKKKHENELARVRRNAASVGGGTRDEEADAAIEELGAGAVEIVGSAPVVSHGKPNLLLDSGASRSIIGIPNVLRSERPLHPPVVFRTVSGEKHTLSVEGDLLLMTPARKQLLIRNVAFNPQCKDNLISPGQWLSQRPSLEIRWTANKAFVYISSSAARPVVAEANKNASGVFELDVEIIPPEPVNLAATAASATSQPVPAPSSNENTEDVAASNSNVHTSALAAAVPSSSSNSSSNLSGTTAEAQLQLIHRRLGHLNIRAVAKMVKEHSVLGLGERLHSIRCVPCAHGKATRLPFGKTLRRLPASKPFQRVHADVMGPFRTAGTNGARYALIILCEYTRFVWAYPILTKSQTFERIQRWHDLVRNQFEAHVKEFHSDHGGEFTGAAILEYWASFGIVATTTPRNTPQWNALVERLNGTLLNGVRTLQTEGNMPSQFWNVALDTFVYILNRTVPEAASVSAYENLHQEKPDLSHARVYGCDAYVHEKNAAGKMAAKVIPMVFTGYVPLRMAYRFFEPVRKIFVTERDAYFNENSFTIGRPSPAAAQPHTLQLSLDALLAPIEDFNEFPLVTEPSERAAAETGSETQPVAVLPAEEQELPAETNMAENETTPYGMAEAPASHVTAQQSGGEGTQGGLLWLPAGNGSNMGHQVRRSARNMARNSAPGAAAASAGPAEASQASQPAVEMSGGENLNQIAGVNPDDYQEEALSAKTEKELAAGGEKAEHTMEESSASSAGSSASKRQTDPATYAEAVSSASAKGWRKAMEEEMISQERNQTWTVIPRSSVPPGKRVLGCKWVFKTKHHMNGIVARLKARIVAKGFQQRHGIDYFDTFAPTMAYRTLKALLTVAAAYDWEIKQFDVNTAFLHASIEEEIYMELPPGFTIAGMVAKLRKALYGIKQAPRAWNKELHAFLVSLGFQRLVSDQCVYVKFPGPIYLAVFVDDAIIIYRLEVESAWLECKGRLFDRFDVKDLGDATSILGMRITRDRKARTIVLDQKSYITKMVEQFNGAAGRAFNTPMAERPSESSSPSTDSERAVMEEEPYQQLIGSLLYAAVNTRPDISFAVAALTRYTSNPGPAHMAAARRVLRYLSTSAGLGLRLGGMKTPLAITIYTDADWAGSPDDAKSTSGVVVMLGSGAICWTSRKQKQTSLSSMESEFVALVGGVQDAKWLCSLMEELRMKNTAAPKLLIDNQSAVAYCRTGGSMTRTRHVNIRYHFVRDSVESGEVDLDWIPTERQLADIMTKPLERAAFTRIVSQLMEETD